MNCIAVHITGVEPRKPVNLFSYAAFTASNDTQQAFTPPENRAYANELVKVFAQHWRLTSFDDAAVIVYANPFRDCPATHELARRAQAAGKPLIFLESGETEPPSTVPYGTVYRNSIISGAHRRPHEYLCPAWHGDLLAECRLSAVAVLPKPDHPAVGFCGFVGTPVSRLIYRMAGRKKKVDGLVIREKVLRALARAPEVEGRFIRRSQYLGGATLATFEEQNELKQQRAEYLANIFDCPYGLAIRGKGNHSVRFFEILCAGRIPVFINTDCALPFDDQLDYRRHVVWIEYEQRRDAGRILAEFNRNVKPETFAQMQLDNRRLWEEWLSPVAFHRRVVKACRARSQLITRIEREAACCVE